MTEKDKCAECGQAMGSHEGMKGKRFGVCHADLNNDPNWREQNSYVKYWNDGKEPPEPCGCRKHLRKTIPYVPDWMHQ